MVWMVTTTTSTTKSSSSSQVPGLEGTAPPVAMPVGAASRPPRGIVTQAGWTGRSGGPLPRWYVVMGVPDTHDYLLGLHFVSYPYLAAKLPDHGIACHLRGYTDHDDALAYWFAMGFTLPPFYTTY